MLKPERSKERLKKEELYIILQLMCLKIKM